MPKLKSSLFTTCGAQCLLSFLAASSQAELATSVLHSFSGGSGDGRRSSARLVVAGSTLYGTTVEGGAHDSGTVFSLDMPSNTFTLLHSFADGSDGSYPWAGVTLSGSTLYGTTATGTLFSIDTVSHAYKILRYFGGGASDGSNPQSNLTLLGSKLYGTTNYGGTANRGTLFSFDTTNNAFKVLHSFQGGQTDGTRPVDLVLSGSTLYGVTQYGGKWDQGTLFEFDTISKAFSLRHTFKADIGTGAAYPQRGLAIVGSTVYGIANGGGPRNYGAVYSFDTLSNRVQTLSSFGGGGGFSPFASSGSVLYGTADSVTTSMVFSLDTATNAITVLHTFDRDGDVGFAPYESPTLSGSTLYGTTALGGALGGGTIFAIQLPEPSGLALAALGAASLLSFVRLSSRKNR